jgi:SAM-dependent methyltransferase
MKRPFYTLGQMARNLLCHASLVQQLKFRLSQSGRLTDVGYTLSVFQRHFPRLESLGFTIEGAYIAEMGPGDAMSMELLLYVLGASGVCGLDVVAVTDANTWHPAWEELTRWAEEQVTDSEKAALERRVELAKQMVLELSPEHCLEAENLSGLHYLLVSRSKPWPLPDGSMDLIFSQAVMEHVAPLEASYIEQARVLKPGGYISHRIDLKDHLNSRDWRDHLTYSELQWSLMTSHRPGFTNRARASQHLAALERAGLEILHVERQMNDAPPLRRSLLAAAFRDLDDEDLNTCSLDVVARKRQPS